MPTSEINTVPAIVHEACRLQPKSILDLGAGRGKYGVLLREYLDGDQAGSSFPNWKLTINAVEGFYKYVTDLHYAVYNSVWVEDFSNEFDKYHGYDLVLMIDSLEHLHVNDGLRVLHSLLNQNKHIIVSVPWGPYYLEQGAVFGNEFERHRHSWDLRTFAELGGREIYRGVCSAWSIPGRGK